MFGDIRGDIEADAATIINLWSDMAAMGELGMSQRVWDAAVGGMSAREQGEVLWRVVWVEREMRRRRAERAKDGANA